MASIEPLKDGFKRYGSRGFTLLACLTLIASALLATSFIEIAGSTPRQLIIGSILGLTTALFSARHPIRFPGTGTSVSVSEALIFFAVMILGPYYGVLLTFIETLIASGQLKIRRSLYIFNISNVTVSVFVAGKIYYALRDYLADHKLTTGKGQAVLEFALPLIAMAFAHYLLHIIVLVVMSLARGRSVSETIGDTLPWEPVTYLACATLAGLVNYAIMYQGPLTTVVILVLVLPIPIIIYYTFKTYHDKLGEQEKHYGELTNIYDSILEMLAMAIDAKDDVTHDHIQRVKLFACRMGERIGLSDLEIEALKAGALLHDIGKIGVPAYILNKPGKLTEHEFEQMKMHTIIGADMLSNIDFRYPVVPIVRHHHEHWDGRGYPDGLKGEQIPITARILTLVDNYDALRSDRPYHRALSREEALDYIKRNAGTFFDPSLVEIFLSVVDQLEAEATTFKLAPPGKHSQVNSQAMQSARPATGFYETPKLDRAAAALNSIAESNQRVTALYEMSRTLSSILSVEDTMAILVSRLSKLIPFTTCAISLFDDSRSEFEIAYVLGLHADKFLKRRMPAEAGITGWVITNQRPMFNTNPVLDLGFLGADAAGEYKGVIVFPLAKNKDALGAIALYSTEIESYASEHIQLMESVSQPASDAIYNALAFEQAQRAAFTDPATGLASLRALTTQFDRELAHSQRLASSLSIITVRVNNLDEAAAKSKLNSGQMLAQVGKLIREQVRETDLVARESINTFIALLPESGRTETNEVLRRICEAINDETHVLVSLGAATSPDDGKSFEDLLQAARMDSIDSRQNINLTPAGLNDRVATRPA